MILKKKKYSIKEYIAKRVQEKNKKKETNEDKLKKAREEFYLK